MDQDNYDNTQSQTVILARKSWTAYVAYAFTALIPHSFVISLAWALWVPAGWTVLALSSALNILVIMQIRSTQLFCDDAGIWVYSGILPWAKGINGIKWRDLDEAVFRNSLFSWMWNSYTVQIGHRYTKSSEIVLTHMARGHEAVMQINDQHEELVRSEALR